MRKAAATMITPPLNLVYLVATLLGIQGAVPLSAAINLISVQHRVWGDAGQSPTSYYDATSSVSLSRSISSLTGGYYYTSSSASKWSVSASRDGDGYYSNGFAQNSYVFTPLSRQLSILLGGKIGVWWFENDARMTLTDRTTNSLVSLYQSPSYSFQNPFSGTNDMVDYQINWNATVEVNPQHTYELILFVRAHRGEGGSGSASLDLTVMPEPRTAMLAGIAVLLTCARRQRLS